MKLRTPNRYRLTVYDSKVRTQYRAMWAFSAADVVVQHQVDQQGFSHPDRLVRIEPWSETMHGPWPEQL